ncbi:MAG: glutamate--tRNA ligase [Parcubacteria group bacterium]|nr:glutamate--tRNA ligase [Parcubacteria group bacterium]
MIRVRFAPSPTGYLHIGSLRTFLFNYLFAKAQKGKLILRIEDTDRNRFVEGAVSALLEILTKMGFKWDEGPFLRYRSVKIKNQKSKIKNKEEEKIIQKGKYGPYMQSQRLETYRSAAQKLIENNSAYYCFCSTETLEQMKREQTQNKMAPRYDGRCKNLDAKTVQEKLRAGKYVIRLKVPKEGSIVFDDLIHGKVEFKCAEIDDQILLKSDGWPTYHLANVVDDYSMKITHVIRADEWLTSTPKHILLYRAFGWEPPQFAHIPLILNLDKSKLSKRQGDVAVEDYLLKGYLPDALINYIALLGWNSDTDTELFSLKELAKLFSLKKVQKTGAIFDVNKLQWMNGLYIRRMKSEKIFRLLENDFRTKYETNYKKYKKSQIMKMIALERERAHTLNEIVSATSFFFEIKKYAAELLLWKKQTKEAAREILQKEYEIIEKIPATRFTPKNILSYLQKLAEQYSNGEVFWPFRVALTGEQNSPPPQDIASILGKDEVLKRLGRTMERMK